MYRAPRSSLSTGGFLAVVKDQVFVVLANRGHCCLIWLRVFVLEILRLVPQIIVTVGDPFLQRTWGILVVNPSLRNFHRGRAVPMSFVVCPEGCKNMAADRHIRGRGGGTEDGCWWEAILAAGNVTLPE